MHRHRRILMLAILLAAAAPGMAQQAPRDPHIGYIYPAGGRQDTTFQVTVGGQYLDTVMDAYVSGEGIKATVIEHIKPLQPGQAAMLRDQLQELRDKRMTALDFGAAARPKGASQPASRPATKPVWTADDDKKMAEIIKKLATFVRKPSSPAIAETVTLEVKVAASAQPGEHELRLGTLAGLSNPMVFCVGQLPEFCEKPAKGSGEPTRSVARDEMTVTLPATVNGQIMPGGVDRYRFQAKKGQHLVIAVSARELIPYLADAVPGWFQPTLALFDPSGHELAYAEDFRFSPDPVLHYEIPKDGEYAFEVKDSIYRGREDFVYRITAGELPFITSIFPLGGKAGTAVELTGWNLPVTRTTPPATNAGIVQVFTTRGEMHSNSVQFAVDTLPECAAQNAQSETGQLVTPPIIINGRIVRPGQRDVFRFEGQAGQQIVAEVFARRLGSPLDSILRLTDSAGKELAVNDDHDDKGSGLLTQHADSYISFTLPASGTYYIHLTDVQGHGGSEYGYRLRISAPRPDYELRVVPSSITVRGGSAPLTVYAIRRDGFSGEIALSLKDAPAGFALSGAKIPANQDQVRLTLSVPAGASKEAVSPSLEGRATIQGQEVRRMGVPAEDMMQAFLYRHLVPSRELLVAAVGRTGARAALTVVESGPMRIAAGGTARLHVRVPATTFLGDVQLELNEPPAGLTIQSVTPSGGTTEIVFKGDPAKLKAGLKGNLILDAFVERTPPAANGKPGGPKRRMPMGTLPAIPFEVVTQ